jgi:hypothetical protein
LLTGNIGSLCEQQPLKALRAPAPLLLADLYLNIKYYIIEAQSAFFMCYLVMYVLLYNYDKLSKVWHQ